MSGEAGWRSGAAAYALALAGYWSVRLGITDPNAAARDRATTYGRGDLVRVEAPLLVLDGALNVVEERTGHAPRRVGRIVRGWALVPIGNYPTRPGVRLESAGELTAGGCSRSELLRLAAQDGERAQALFAGLLAALEQQHWALRMSAQATPMARLAALLVRIAEDRGVQVERGLFLAGAPDLREMSVLAGVSRESAVINLEWLVHLDLLQRERGRLWVQDLDALRQLTQEEGE